MTTPLAAAAPRRTLATRNSRWARILAARLAAARVRPNSVSIAGVVFAGMSAVTFYISAGSATEIRAALLLVAAACIQLRLLCNLLDGMLLTGQPPAEAGAASRDLERSQGIPPALKSICRCALSESPSDRFSSASSLAADVARFRDRQAVSVHTEGALERTGRFIRTYQTPILLVLAYIVMRALIAFFAAV